MQRPQSLSFMIAFVLWAVFKSAESLLKSAGTRDLYSYYDLTAVYYATTAFSICAGFALAYALMQAKPWGYVLGYVWLAVAIADSIFTGWVTYSNKELMTTIMTTQRESQGRSTEGIVEFMSTPILEVTALATVTALTLVMVYFAWRLYQNREYFGRER